MDIIEARKIYQHPNGHSKKECVECLNTLNEAMQPMVLPRLQFLCIQDACKRVGSDLRLTNSNNVPNANDEIRCLDIRKRHKRGEYIKPSEKRFLGKMVDNYLDWYNKTEVNL